jgi:serine/threonine-protein kinase
MGEVWKAHDERLGRDVAVKLLDLSAAPDPNVAERFRREAIATAQLNHPNIVSVFDAGTDGTHAYLVMTLLPGRTVAELVRTSGPMPLDQALSLVIQVTSALREAHRHGLVHRDIKPANVIVNGGQATVVDFGIAQLTGLGASLTATHAVIGSAAYMSPEHATGQKVGPAADLYGVGCLLMTMLTGQPPFVGEHAVAVAAQQVSADPPALSERIATPRALDQLVSALLSKDPDARPDAESTLAQLRDVQAHPTTDLIGPNPRPEPLATILLPAAAAVLPSGPVRTMVMPQTGPPAPYATTVQAVVPQFPPPQFAHQFPPQGQQYPPPQAQQYPQPQGPPSGPRPQSRRGWVRVLVWLVVLVALGVAAFALGTQAGALTSLTQTPQPVNSSRATATTAPKTTAKPTTAKPTPTPTVAVTPIALQLAVQGVSQVLASLPAGTSKDRLVADWSTVGAAVLSGDHPNDQLDKFSSRVQKEVRNGDLSIPQGVAVLGSVEAVRAAL